MDQKFIQNIAKRLYSTSVAGSDFEKTVELDDLVHAGVKGYLKADQRFDSDNGGNQGAFYYMRIYGAMVDFLRTQAMVNLPQKRYARYKKAMAVKRRLESSGVEVGDALLAKELGCDLAKLQDLLSSVPRVASAESLVPGQREESCNLFDRLVTEQGKAKQLSTTLKKEIVELLEACLAQLKDPRQRFIIVARFQEDITLKLLSEQFAVTEQAICYQVNQGLDKMKNCLQKNGWQWDGSENELF